MNLPAIESCQSRDVHDQPENAPKHVPILRQLVDAVVLSDPAAPQKEQEYGQAHERRPKMSPKERPELRTVSQTYVIAKPQGHGREGLAFQMRYIRCILGVAPRSADKNVRRFVLGTIL